MESLKPDCQTAPQRKRSQSRPAILGVPFSPVRFAGQLLRNTGIPRVFRSEGCGFSLQPRLRGGVGSLALTFLLPNSLLAGNLTGNFREIWPFKPYCFSPIRTF